MPKVLAQKQKSISSFFTPPAEKKKRTGSSTSGEENEKPPNKIPKEETSPKCSREVIDDAKPGCSKYPDDAPPSPVKESLMTIDFGGSNIKIGKSWQNALKDEFEKDYFKKLSQFLAGERKTKTIYPPEDEVFSWTKLHNIRKTKVVIIGQDPYHGPQQAHGLCFSVCPGVKPPPSLKNIYKELVTDVEGFTTPDHGHLIGWSSQGVLLLNACLTVVASQANAHKGRGWEKFTDAVIKWLNTHLEGVVFVLWGMYAQKKGSSINKTKHLVLAGKHPSPLSAHGGFFGCKHFSKANEYLKQKGEKEIDWNFLPQSI